MTVLRKITRRSFAIGFTGAAGASALAIASYRGAIGDEVIKSRGPSSISLRRIIRVPIKSETFSGSAALSLAWSPDGRRLAASFDWGRQILVLDTSTWKEVSRIKGKTFQPERKVAFISNAQVISAPNDNNLESKLALEVYDAETGRLVKQIPRPSEFEIGLMGAVAVTSGRKYVAVIAGRNGEATLLFEVQSGKFIGKLAVPAGSRTTVIASGPGSELVASAYVDPSLETRKEIYVLDAATNAVDRVLAGHVPNITSLAWSPNGRLIASGQTMFESNGGKKWIRDLDPIRIWSVETGELVASFVGMFDPVGVLAWHPSSNLLATGSGRGDDDRGSAIRLWSIPKKQLEFEWFTPDGDQINAMVFHPSTGQLVWVWDGALDVFDVLGIT